jgi:murein DD-endopeptidase MepM/ murein hydrolase activator NlpD
MRRVAMSLVLLTALLAGPVPPVGTASVAGAAVIAPSTPARAPITATPATTNPTPPDLPANNLSSGGITPGPGITGAPLWFPLRGTWVIGCTWGGGCDGHHRMPAVDLATDRMGRGAGGPVYAAGAGLARTSGGGGGCGSADTTVEIDHGGGVSSRYLHLQSLAITTGTWVGPNTVIGYVGNTGSVSPCSFNHLHFEVLRNGTPVPPGQLRACVDGRSIELPGAIGAAEWNQPPLWSIVRNDGTDCDLGRSPIGAVDEVSSDRPNELIVRGWAIDPDSPDWPVGIHIYVDGPAGSDAMAAPLVLTDRPRPDVAAVLGMGAGSGFEARIAVAAGVRAVHVYAIDGAGGENALLGTGAAPIAPSLLCAALAPLARRCATRG